ncbi:MAG: alpha/beta hydrolase domain-containing protein, partial [Alphaproteobacteria bacterium]|nr:alpha/beta hydrolase domain-containing protein [Alphaproteobacteria bacterium]
PWLADYCGSHSSGDYGVMTNLVQLEICDRRPFAGGARFGGSGAYERIAARAHHRVDPLASPQLGVTDIGLAPRDADGLVGFSADVFILQPADPALGNRRLLFDWGNRGNKRALQYFCDAEHSNDPETAAHAGNGFLFRRGYTIVFGAWQGDLLPGEGRMLLDLPVARHDDGPVTGLVRTEFIADEPGVTCLPLSGCGTTRSHPAISLDTARARLTMRPYADAPRQSVPVGAWSFARLETGGGLDGLGPDWGVAPSDSHIFLPGGFRPGWIYEIVYEGCDPLVMGLGHVAVRDLVSWLRYEEGAGNPLGAIDRAYGYGRSQTGRAIRDFVWQGFNADARGRRVFDGLMPHVSGAGGKWLNQRFANAVVSGGQQHEDHYAPADRFPFAYSSCADPYGGGHDAILKRPDTDPLILHTQTATEYWQRRGSLVHTDCEGNDLAEPEGVRIYHWAGTQHTADPNQREPRRAICEHWLNIAQTSMLFRAMLDALDRWAEDGTPPPPSRYPRIADGTLVPYETWRRQFPSIPGGTVPQAPNKMPALNFGPRSRDGFFETEPPEVLAEEGYPVLVPSVDADGNEIAGVRAPMIAAPIGTFAGWNIRRRGVAGGAMHEFSGSYIPFPDTPEERTATGDPRPSLLERYGDAAGYLQAVEAAAQALIEEGFMLEEDLPRVRARAQDWSRPLSDVGLP